MGKPRVKHYTKQQEEMFWRLTGVYSNGKVFTIWEEVENCYGKEASDSRDWRALYKTNNDLQVVTVRFETELGILIQAKFINRRWERHFCETPRQAEEKSVRGSERAIRSVIRATQINEVAQGPKYGLSPNNPTQMIVSELTKTFGNTQKLLQQANRYIETKYTQQPTITWITCPSCSKTVPDGKLCFECGAKLH